VRSGFDEIINEPDTVGSTKWKICCPQSYERKLALFEKSVRCFAEHTFLFQSSLSCIIRNEKHKKLMNFTISNISLALRPLKKCLFL
jgi:hypothetical protein